MHCALCLDLFEYDVAGPSAGRILFGKELLVLAEDASGPSSGVRRAGVDHAMARQAGSSLSVKDEEVGAEFILYRHRH